MRLNICDAKRSDDDVAYQALVYLNCGSCRPEFEKSVLEIFSGCTSAQEKARALFAFCKPLTSPFGVYCKAKVSTFCGAAYRPQMIEAITEYLESKELYAPVSTNAKGVSPVIHETAFMYSDLGKAFEGEYLIEDALRAYKKGSEVAPMYIHNYIKAAKAMVKLGRFDEALEWVAFTESQSNWGETERRDIDLLKSQIQDKKKRGYKYTPRRGTK